jgi:hypothetical protein
LLAEVDGKSPLYQYSFRATEGIARACEVTEELNKLFYLEPSAATTQLGAMASAPAAMENLVGPRVVMVAPAVEARGSQLGLNLGRNGFLTGPDRIL